MRRKYPWEKWFGRSRTVILRGVHYRCSQSAMVQTIRNNASQRGVRVRVTDTDTEITIEVRSEEQAIPSIRDALPATRVTTA